MHDLTLLLMFKYLKGKKQHSQHIKPKIVYTFYTEALLKCVWVRHPYRTG